CAGGNAVSVHVGRTPPRNRLSQARHAGGRTGGDHLGGSAVRRNEGAVYRDRARCRRTAARQSPYIVGPARLVYGPTAASNGRHGCDAAEAIFLKNSCELDSAAVSVTSAAGEVGNRGSCPIPEPATAMMLLASICCLTLRIRR